MQRMDTVSSGLATNSPRITIKIILKISHSRTAQPSRRVVSIKLPYTSKSQIRRMPTAISRHLRLLASNLLHDNTRPPKPLINIRVRYANHPHTGPARSLPTFNRLNLNTYPNNLPKTVTYRIVPLLRHRVQSHRQLLSSRSHHRKELK